MKTTLTDRAVKAAKHDISDAVVPGFMLRVRPSGAKSFALLARFPGSSNPTRRTIAKVGELKGGLTEARTKARAWLELLARGIDPAGEVERERREQNRKRKETIAALAEAYLVQHVREKLRSAYRIEQSIRDVLVPLFGHRPIAELTHQEVSTALREIEMLGTDHGLVKLGARKALLRPTRKPSPSPQQGRGLFIQLDCLLQWAADTGDFGIAVSPLKRVKKAKRFGPAPKRDRILDDAEIGAVWRASGNLRTPFRQFYRLLFLTGLRLAEVLEADWREFDLKARKWTIPAARMKGKNGSAQKHTVPLTSHMLDVLNELARGQRGPFVFSVNGGQSPINRGKLKLMLDEAMAADLRVPDSQLPQFTNHDLRRTLSSHGGDIGIEPIVIEKMLAHTLPGAAGIYNRNQYLDQRREGHEKWGAFLLKCAGERGNVVAMRNHSAAI